MNFKYLPQYDPFELFMAMVAGQKYVANDGAFEVIAYRYKDITYITEINKNQVA